MYYELIVYFFLKFPLENTAYWSSFLKMNLFLQIFLGTITILSSVQD